MRMAFTISGSISEHWVSNDYIVVKENSTTLKVVNKERRRLGGNNIPKFVLITRVILKYVIFL